MECLSPSPGRPDEANYHHLHLHTIIAHQKGHACASVSSSSRYISCCIPCFQLCKKKKVYLFFVHHVYIYIRTLIASECIVHVIWIDTHADTYNTQGGGERSLIPCGEREEIFAYVCNKAYRLHHWARLCDLCAPKESTPVTLGSALFPSSPLPAAAACSLMRTASRQGMRCCSMQYEEKGPGRGETWHEIDIDHAVVGRESE